MDKSNNNNTPITKFSNINPSQTIKAEPKFKFLDSILSDQFKKEYFSDNKPKNKNK